MKTLFQLFLRFLFSLVFFIDFLTVYFVSALLLPLIIVNSDFKEDENGIKIFITSNGVHTDIVMPVITNENNWFEFLPAHNFEAVTQEFEYVAIGWGDKGFYLNTPQWKDLTFSTAFNAAFGLSETAMHVTYIYSAPRENNRCKSVCIDKERYMQMINLIKESFELNSNNDFVPINHPGYSQYDCFYEAKGTYHIFNTCNVWTGKILKKAGIKIGIWTPFESSILTSLN